MSIKNFLADALLLGVILGGCAIGVSTASAATVFTHSFGRGASDKETGGEVSAMQKILAKDKVIYPEALITGYFGPATERALQRYQKKNAIVTSGTPATTGYGFVGRRTRVLLNGEVTAGTITSVPHLVMQSSGDVTLTRTTQGTNVGANTISITGENVASIEKITVEHAGLPDGVVTTLASGCTLPCRLQNSLTVPASVSPGIYAVTVKARQGNTLFASVLYTLTVTESNNFTISIRRTVPMVVQKPLSGTVSTSTNIIIDRVTGVAEPVTVYFGELPKNITGNRLIGKCTPPCKVAARLSTAPDVVTGMYTIPVNVVSTQGTTTHSFTFSVMYPPKFSYHISGPAEYKSFTATQPTAAPVSFPIPLDFMLDGGVAQIVTLKLPTKLPDGINATLSNSSCTLPCRATLTLTVLPGIKVGSYSVMLSGSAKYTDDTTGKETTMSKTYTTSVKVVSGNQN